MTLTKLQEDTIKERMKIIKKFQKEYKTREEKEEALRNMSDNDISFLIYCMDNIHGKIFYSKFLTKKL
ncbi:MAG: hypothetical protein IJ094_11960 [Bacilli bacterium]|nr:hypothetical protein [Bacilli bacterium]